MSGALGGVEGKVCKFRRVNVVIEIGGVVDGGITRKLVVEIVFVVGNGLVRAPLDDETAVLNERLIFVESKRFKAGNCGLGDGQFGSAVTRDHSAGDEGQKMVIPAGVASWREGNCASAACAESIEGVFIFEKLDITAKFKAQHLVKIGRWGARDDGVWAHGVGDAVRPGKLV